MRRSLAATLCLRLAMNVVSFPDFLSALYRSTSSRLRLSEAFSKYGPLPARASARCFARSALEGQRAQPSPD